MDFLPLPRNSALAEIEVPFLAAESFDGGDFLTCPGRYGWTAILITGSPDKGIATHDRDSVDLRALGAFL